MRDRMHSRVFAHLNDGCGSYTPPRGGAPTCDIQLIVDHNLERAGAEGVFRTDATGITFRKVCLARVERGGMFEWCGRRFIVEDEISDDGHVVTVACMEQK